MNKLHRKVHPWINPNGVINSNRIVKIKTKRLIVAEWYSKIASHSEEGTVCIRPTLHFTTPKIGWMNDPTDVPLQGYWTIICFNIILTAINGGPCIGGPISTDMVNLGKERQPIATLIQTPNGGTFFLEVRKWIGKITSGFGFHGQVPYLPCLLIIIWRLKKAKGIDVESQAFALYFLPGMKGLLGPKYSGNPGHRDNPGESRFQRDPRYPGTREHKKG